MFGQIPPPVYSLFRHSADHNTFTNELFFWSLKKGTRTSHFRAGSVLGSISWFKKSDIIRLYTLRCCMSRQY